MRDAKAEPKLDGAAASAIYREIITHDSVIAAQQATINNAALDTRDALSKMEQAYNARKVLSDQLDRFAPDGFMEQGEMASAPLSAPPQMPVAPWAPSAPAAPPMPYGIKRAWHKPNPMPQRTHRPRQSETDFSSDF